MKRFAPLSLGVALAALTALPASAQDRVQIEWWYAVNGRLGDLAQEIITRFNASQDQYEVVGTYKGNYEESMAAMVAAYRVGQQPTILMAAERGFMTMLNSGAVVPVNQLMAAQGYDVDWDDFIAPVAGFYVVDGEPAALPFNSSTPILWYNADQFRAAGFDGPADTWQELEQQLYTLKAQGISECPMVLNGDFQWGMLENYSAINDMPWGTKANGFDGLDTEFVYNTTGVVDQATRMGKWMEDGVLHLAGEGMNPQQMYIAETCATLIASTAGHAGVEQGAQFDWSATYLPHEAGITPKNSTIGGGALWVVNGKSDAEYAGAAAFLNFVSSPELQSWWSGETGYVPVTNTAYETMRDAGYFEAHPTREIAILQLSRGTPSDNSRGFRFGNHNQATAILVEEMQAIWTGQKTAQQALDSAVARGNDILRQYERIHAGR
ncbi:sn-glycerol 3-phosphate transport system substrate-binding protein [Ketogulonicigenium robustum]|uniref:sn-glycerol-3-phosphate-binding periplasmic protein UgpB n=1 Tax=Ketogulonicigenium robustum TaxID=92947 RepID=A0A1W6P1E5_9RHOB|nr:extracellular solute-binding protein [Ketogulonicigenium robustum]ARO15259.1 sn-glycerol 3-phosphate transport system substrate-binding protein [Ketogulonicigenium robustum]